MYRVSLKKIVFVLLFLLAGAEMKAQEAAYRTLIFQIDSLATVGLPKSALKKVAKLELLARSSGQPSWQIKAVIYRIKFLKDLDENAINVIIAGLKKDIGNSRLPEKAILQSLLAEMYWQYYESNRYRFSKRSVLEKPGDDISNWDLNAIVNEASKWYKLSLSNESVLQKTPLGVFAEVLKGDTATRTLRPTIYDLLVHRALDYFLSEEPAIIKPKLPFSVNRAVFFEDSGVFSSSRIYSNDTSSTFFQGLLLLQQATAFHLKNESKQAIADLDLRRIGFLYDHASFPDKDSVYLKALRKIGFDINSGVVSADALYEIAAYYKRKGNLVMAHYYASIAAGRHFNTVGGKNSAGILKEIERKEFVVNFERYNLPDENLLGSIAYANVKNVSVKVFKLSRSQNESLAKAEDIVATRSRGRNTVDKAQVISYLSALNPEESFTIALPDFKDYKQHRTEFKLSPCKTGEYAVLIRDDSVNDTSLIHLARFSVSRLAFVARKKPTEITELLVTDRRSGVPLPNVAVTVDQRDWFKDKTVRIGSLRSNRDGMVHFTHSGGELNVKLRNGEDSVLFTGISIYNPILRKTSDGLPKQKVILFTDRQVYRPGQTVYLKGLALDVFGDKSELIRGKSMNVELWSANGLKISSKVITTNDYGTFSGDFGIPSNVMNGNFRIATKGGVLNIRVEEYKRPTFNVRLNPVKETYRFNDSISVTGKVGAFAGYGLSDAKIAYAIMRTNTYGDYRYYSPIRNGRLDANIVNISSDTVVSDINGNFKIRFKAQIDQHEQGPGTVYTYNITISSIAPTGETQSATASVTVGDQAIRVKAIVAKESILKDSILIPVSLSNLNGQIQPGKIRAEIYSLIRPPLKSRKRLWAAPDTSIMDETQFNSNFPFYSYAKDVDPERLKMDKLVKYSSVVVTEMQPGYIRFSKLSELESGYYCIKFFAENNSGDTTSSTYYTTLITPRYSGVNDTEDWVIPLDRSGTNKNNVDFYVRLTDPSIVLAEVYEGAAIRYSKWINVTDVRQKISLPISLTANMSVQFLSVSNNRMYSWNKHFDAEESKQNLNVRLVTYRNKLEPGKREQWKLEVRGKGEEHIQAEMVATMYDASLDELRDPAAWPKSLSDDVPAINYYRWNISSTQDISESEPFDYNYLRVYPIEKEYEIIDELDDDNGNYGSLNSDASKRISNTASREAVFKKNAALVRNGYDLVGRVLFLKTGYPGVRIKIAGTSIRTTTDDLGYFKIRVPEGCELVFISRYHAERRFKPKKGFPLIVNFDEVLRSVDPGVKSLQGDPNAEIMLEGAESTVRLAPPPVVEDNSIHDFASIDVPARPLPFMPKPQADLTFRKNFRETAFFYPHLLTNETGEISIDFTVPESLTKWKFRAFAHTKDLRSGYIETEIITQKQLMISGNMPRFFRGGDTITVSARIVNLSGRLIKGNTKIGFYNAENMQLLQLMVGEDNAEKEFEITAGSVANVLFRLFVPRDVNGLKCRLSAVSDGHTDAEEIMIPVLSDKTIVTESMTMMVRPREHKSFVFKSFLNAKSETLKNVSLTFESTQNPVWNAVQALPFLADIPLECSEQLFNKYYANRMASYILNRYPSVQKVLNTWEGSDTATSFSELEQNEELKSALLEETPWLRDAMDEADQKKGIARWFNLNKIAVDLQTTLSKLEKLQLGDGSFPWFAGSRYSDRYISQYILNSIGRVQHILGKDRNTVLNNIQNKALKYLDRVLLSDYNSKNTSSTALSPLVIHAWYTRSYFPGSDVPVSLMKARIDFFNKARQQWRSMGIYEQGMLAIAAHRFKDEVLSGRIIASLKERAKHSREMGMYWTENQSGHFWFQSPVETQSLLIELFTECSGDKKMIDEMKIWLLQNKQLSNWKTTKATAAAIQALLSGQGSLPIIDTAASVVTVGGKDLSKMKPFLSKEAGTGYVKTSWRGDGIRPELASVDINNTGSAINVASMYWQFQEETDKINSSVSDLKLQRKYLIKRQTDKGVVLLEAGSTNKPVSGDIVKVVLYLTANKDFEYIHVKDLRPAGTEPANVLSGYNDQDGLYYYMTNKDVSTNFFINYLPKGKYVLEYTLKAAQSGIFNTGIATVQSMYAPEYNAHTEGAKFEIR